MLMISKDTKYPQLSFKWSMQRDKINKQQAIFCVFANLKSPDSNKYNIKHDHTAFLSVLISLEIKNEEADWATTQIKYEPWYVIHKIYNKKWGNNHFKAKWTINSYCVLFNTLQYVASRNTVFVR